MKRNLYAILILSLLAISLTGGGLYVVDRTDHLANAIEQSFSYTMQGNYPAARRAYKKVYAEATRCIPYLSLLVRRNLVDQLGQTLATLPEYAAPDNLADLAVESARAKAQIEQLRRSYLFVL